MQKLFAGSRLALATLLMSIAWALPAQTPANDDLCNAAPLTVGAGCTTANGDLTGATLEAGETFGACTSTFSQPTNSVWFSFVAPPSGLVIISTNHPTLATITGMDMTLYQLADTTCALDSLTEIACNQAETQNGTSGPEPLPTIAAELTPGATYYIQVTGDFDFGTAASVSGAFCIDVEELQPPVNDDVCSPIAVPLDSAAIEFHNVGATSVFEFALAPPFNPSDILGLTSWGTDFQIRRSIWFTFVAPASGAVEIDLTGQDVIGNFNSKIALYAATDCNDLSTFSVLHAQALTAVPISPTSSILIQQSYLPQVTCLTPGDTYYLLVDGVSNSLLFGVTNGLGRGLIQINTIDLEPLTLPTEAVVFDAYCAGDTNGAIGVQAKGGANGLQGFNSVEAYTYGWSNGDMGPYLKHVAPGTYTVIATDVCDSTVSMSYTVEGSSGPAITMSADTQVCAGETVSLAALLSGGRPMDSPRAYVAAATGFGTANGQLLVFEPGNFLTADTLTTDTLPRFFSLAYASGQLYALSNASQLFTIDPATGTHTLVDTLVGDHGSETFRAIDYNLAEGRMEGITDASRLFILDLTTAATTFLDTVPATFNTLSQMAIDTAGMYYFTDGSNSGLIQRLETNLLRYQPGNASVDTLGTFDFIDASVTALAVDPRDNTPYLLYNRRILGAPNATHHEMYRWDASANTLVPTVLMEEIPTRSIYYSLAFAPATMDPYTYMWSPEAGLSDPNSAHPMVAVDNTTTFVVTVMDACGMTTDSITVTVDMPTLSLSSTPDNTGSSGTATASVSGGVSPYTFLWSNGATTETLSALAAGTYSVVVTDALGCSSTDSVEVLSTVGIDLLAQAGIAQWEVFPNPAHAQVRVQARLNGAQAQSLSLYHATGQRVHHQVLTGSPTVDVELPLHNLASGVYILRLQTSQGQAMQRIVRQ
jgi:hypothetical protein